MRWCHATRFRWRAEEEIADGGEDISICGRRGSGMSDPAANTAPRRGDDDELRGEERNSLTEGIEAA
jgi:hypothetical protein